MTSLQVEFEKLLEQQRHNTVTEDEQQRHNLETEKETAAKADLAKEQAETVHVTRGVDAFNSRLDTIGNILRFIADPGDLVETIVGGGRSAGSLISAISSLIG